LPHKNHYFGGFKLQKQTQHTVVIGGNYRQGDINMENVKKWLLKRVLFIVIGLVPIIILYDDSSIYRYLALVGFIFIIFNLVKIFGAYQEIIAAFSPKDDNSKIGKYDKFFNSISGE